LIPLSFKVEDPAESGKRGMGGEFKNFNIFRDAGVPELSSIF
jgi:hypothetical protein